MNISYEIIKPFEPFGMPTGHPIKNVLLLKEIKEVIEVIFQGACAAWRLSKIMSELENEKADLSLVEDSEKWMRVVLERLGAVTVLTKLRQLYIHKGVNNGFTMMVQYRLPNDPERRGEYMEYVHGREPNRASMANTRSGLPIRPHS